MRQNRLAKMIGMDETILSKIVNGFREPSPQMQKRIADLLDSDATWLFEPADSGVHAEGNGQPLNSSPTKLGKAASK